MTEVKTNNTLTKKEAEQANKNKHTHKHTREKKSKPVCWYSFYYQDANKKTNENLKTNKKEMN